MARKIGQSYSVALCFDTRVWIEFGKEPNLDKLETEFELFSRSAGDTRFPLWKSLSIAQLSLLEFFRGNWTKALSHAQSCCGSEPHSAVEGMGAGILFRQMSYAGDRDGAFATLDTYRERLPRIGKHNIRGSWWVLMMTIEGLSIMGEHRQAALLYPLARELIATEAKMLWPIPRFTYTIAGIAAASARKWSEAGDYFKAALQQAEAFPQLLELADIRRFHAMMLIDRGASGDRKQAETLLDQALSTYRRIGMRRHSEITQVLIGR